jgi:hypothetical protein
MAWAGFSSALKIKTDTSFSQGTTKEKRQQMHIVHFSVFMTK